MKKVIVILAIVFGSLAAGVFLLAVGAMLVFLGFGGWFAQPRGDVLTYEVDPEFTSKGRGSIWTQSVRSLLNG